MTESPSPGRGRTVALIDDDAPVVRLGQRVLERLGYEVITFERADDALEGVVAERGRIDAILTDYRMPNMTGLELLRRMREQGVESPALVVTAFPEEIDGDTLRSLAATPAISKPYSLRDLSERLAELIERGGSHRA